MNCSQPGSSVHGDSPGKNTREGCHALLQGILPSQGSNPGLPHCRQILYHLSTREAHTCFRYTSPFCLCLCGSKIISSYSIYGNKDVYNLIPKTYECITLHGKSNLADVIKKWDGKHILNYAGGPSVITRVFIWERQEGLSKRRCDYRSRDQNEVKKGSWAKECTQPTEAKKGK